MQTQIDYPATQKQFDFIKSLIGRRMISEALAVEIDEARRLAMTTGLSRGAASRLIDDLLAAPDLPAAPEPKEPVAGVYRHSGDLYRVYLGQTSGRMLVKRIVVEAYDGLEDSVRYEYLGSAWAKLPSGAERLPLAEVGSLGLAFNQCLMCGHRLDVPESVDRGIGPVCAAKYGA